MASISYKLQHYGLYFLCGFLLVLSIYLAYKNWYAKTLYEQRLRNVLHTFYLRVDQNLPGQSIIIIGDSHVQGLCAVCLDPMATAMGIGKEKVTQTHFRLKTYTSVKSATAIVVQVGYNDLRAGSDNKTIVNHYASMLDEIEEVLTIVTAPFAVDEMASPNLTGLNRRIETLNIELAEQCDARPACRFMDINKRLTDNQGNLKASLHNGDGVHLSATGYTIWIDAIKSELKKSKRPAK